MDSTSLCSPASLYFPLPCEMLLLDIHFLVDVSSLSNMTMPFHCLPASIDEQSATSSTEAPPLWKLFVSCCLSRFFSCGLHQSDSDVTVFTYHAWGSRTFLGMHINLFHQIWKVFSHYFQKHCCAPSLLSPETAITWMLSH